MKGLSWFRFCWVFFGIVIVFRIWLEWLKMVRMLVFLLFRVMSLLFRVV